MYTISVFLILQVTNLKIKEEILKYENEYKLWLEKWGEIDQIDMLIEEMAELIKALSKYKRLVRFPENHAGRKKEYLDNVKEEIADVSHGIGQMTIHFGEKEINEIRNQKVERVKKRHFSDDSKKITD